MEHKMNRQRFIEFLGLGTLGFMFPMHFFKSNGQGMTNPLDDLIGVQPSLNDDVILAPGLSYSKLISWGDPIAKGLKFGSHNDYIGLLPISASEALLWVNHEYFDSLLVTGKLRSAPKSLDEIQKEMTEVGGSIIKIKKEGEEWIFMPFDEANKRIDGRTKIQFAAQKEVLGSSWATGTLANCSGGITPWGTILTCEENYDMFYGERMEDGSVSSSVYGWEKHVHNPPEHYGWVVEVDCFTGKSKKHTSLGRCAHECATVISSSTGHTVVYTGDDKEDECLYKFISKSKNNLDEGTLYVASIEKGRWLSLNIEEQAILKEHFNSQMDVQINLRKAAKLVGGTPMDRPEDIEVDPITGAVLISLTNNLPKGNYFGSVLKIVENSDYDGLEFRSEVYLAGGTETGFACPDNLAFDPQGNLWFTSDISGSKVGKGNYTPFKNNGLFMVPRSGKQAGKVIQMASAPVDAEFTGPCFAPDGKHLFLSVQHPGETTVDLKNPTSNWPDRKGSLPKSSVIVISGI